MGTLLQVPATVQHAATHIPIANELIAYHYNSVAQLQYRLLISSKNPRYKETPFSVCQRGPALHCYDSAGEGTTAITLHR